MVSKVIDTRSLFPSRVGVIERGTVSSKKDDSLSYDSLYCSNRFDTETERCVSVIGIGCL